MERGAGEVVVAEAERGAGEEEVVVEEARVSFIRGTGKRRRLRRVEWDSADCTY